VYSVVLLPLLMVLTQKLTLGLTPSRISIELVSKVFYLRLMPTPEFEFD
jgi:hypothetical protein